MKILIARLSLSLVIMTFVVTGQNARSETLQTDIWLTITVHEIKIKKVNESFWGQTGAFYFIRKIDNDSVRLPATGVIYRRADQYIKPTEKTLKYETFWQGLWQTTQANLVAIGFEGYVVDAEGNEDFLGAVNAVVDVSNFGFIAQNTYQKLERTEFHIVYSIRCEPRISSSTHQDSTKIYNYRTVQLEWTRVIPDGGILGYSYEFDHNCCTQPDDVLEGTHTTISYLNLTAGSYWFHVKARDKVGFWSNTGHFKVTIGSEIGISDNSSEEHAFQLFSNYPNPFNAHTIISYWLPHPAMVIIQIYNLNGQLMAFLSEGYQPAGIHHITWNGTGSDGNMLASGIYFCVLRVDQSISTRKITFVK